MPVYGGPGRGLHFYDWLEDFEDACVCNGWLGTDYDLERRAALRRALEADAITWRRSMTTQEWQASTCEELMDRMIEELEGGDRHLRMVAERRLEARRQQPEESVRIYYCNKQRLANHVGINMNGELDMFCDGLLPVYKEVAAMFYETGNTKDLVRRLQLWERFRVKTRPTTTPWATSLAPQQTKTNAKQRRHDRRRHDR